jgi:phage major head subunit gpT-like protein
MLQQVLGNLDKITPDMLEALNGQFQTIIESDIQAQAAADAAEPPWYVDLVEDVPTLDLAAAIEILTAPLTLLKWDTDRVAQNLAKQLVLIVLETLECSVGIDRNHILYASKRLQLPRVLQGITQVEENYKLDHIGDLVVNGYKNEAAYLGFDGAPVFSDSHPIDKKFVATGKQKNYYSDLDLNGDNVTAVEAAMRQFKGQNGRPMKVRPKKLYHSHDLTAQAKQVCDVDRLANGASNPNYGKFKRVPLEGVDTTNTWCLADPNYALKLAGFLHAIKTAFRWIVMPGQEKRQGLWGYDEDAKIAPFSWYQIVRCVHTP